MNKKLKYKEKKVRTGGVYWVDFSGFKLPEWGNTESNTPHLSILIKSNDFMGKEMFISLPTTSNDEYLKKYGERLVHKIILEERVHYVLINQTRIIGKHRVGMQFRLATGEDIFIKSNDLKEVKNKLDNFFQSKISSAIKARVKGRIMMSRKIHGRKTVTKVFRKSAEIVNRDPALWRADRAGRVIARAAYGDRNSNFGWNIHHRDSNPNNNDIKNLEALHFNSHEEIHK